MAKLDVRAFGLAVGITWGALMLVLGLMNTYLGWGGTLGQVMSSIYIGYSSTIRGSIIGAAWGFIDGGIFAVIIAWLYNKLVR